MYHQRKLAKDYLTQATLTDFWQVVNEAKITKEDKRILDARFVDGLSITQISQQENCSIEKVNKVIRNSYDKVARLI